MGWWEDVLIGRGVCRFLSRSEDADVRFKRRWVRWLDQQTRWSIRQKLKAGYYMGIPNILDAKCSFHL